MYIQHAPNIHPIAGNPRQEELAANASAVIVGSSRERVRVNVVALKRKFFTLK